ncbi:alginate export family protein [Thermodesulfovibrio sp. 3907-1M]|uniref:Alginate export family protein n=1 Tax=Thermodesulfovibrio autotrophicus TaxID=3118333 RepID=A0AAU8GXB4_9BACT
MKKYATILAVLVLLLGLAALSYAAPAEIPSDTTAVIAKGKTQITLGGELRFRGLYGSNLAVKDEGYYDTKTTWYLDPTNGQPKSTTTFTQNKNTSYYDYRVRLNLEAKVSPNTTGYVEVESNKTTDNSSENVTWGSGTKGPKGNYPFGNWHDESNLYIRQAWIQYQGSGLLGVPAGFKVGRQLIKLGYGLFFDHSYYGDDAILVFVQPLKELTIAAHTIKFYEGYPFLNDDSTAYGILAAYAGKGFGLSADITYVDHQNIGNTGFAGLLPDIHLWNFGLRGNVDDIAGTGLNFRADVEFQTGKINDYSTTIDNVKLRGWAALAGLDYKFKAVPLTLTAEYAIGSGDKDSTDNKMEAFITALGPEQHYTFIYEYLAPTACNFSLGTKIGTGLCNTQYVKFGGSYDITKDINAKLYGYWLRAQKAVAINNKSLEKDKDLGWEVDATVTYQIDKGLKYWVEGGYFWPGDAYKLSSGKDAADAWAVRHGIQLNF